MPRIKTNIPRRGSKPLLNKIEQFITELHVVMNREELQTKLQNYFDEREIHLNNSSIQLRTFTGALTESGNKKLRQEFRKLKAEAEVYLKRRELHPREFILILENWLKIMEKNQTQFHSFSADLLSLQTLQKDIAALPADLLPVSAQVDVGTSSSNEEIGGFEVEGSSSQSSMTSLSEDDEDPDELGGINKVGCAKEPSDVPNKPTEIDFHVDLLPGSGEEHSEINSSLVTQPPEEALPSATSPQEPVISPVIKHTPLVDPLSPQNLLTLANNALRHYKAFNKDLSSIHDKRSVHDRGVRPSGPYGMFTYFNHMWRGRAKAEALISNLQGKDSKSLLEEIKRFLEDGNTKCDAHSFSMYLVDEMRTLSAKSFATNRQGGLALVNQLLQNVTDFSDVNVSIRSF
jgi:hypothetical protein